MTNRNMPVFVTNLAFADKGEVIARPALVVKPGATQTGVMRLIFGDQNSIKFDPATCYPLQFWKTAGQKKPIFVDTSILFNIPTPLVITNGPLGKLSFLDIIGLFEFIKK